MENTKEKITRNVVNLTKISEKAKCAPKTRPNLPISLPISFYHTYLSSKKYKKQSSVTIEQVEKHEKKTTENSAQTDRRNDNRFCKSSCVTQTELSSDSLQLYLYVVKSSEEDHNKYCESVDSKFYNINKTIENIECSTQTDEEPMCEKEKQILRIIKLYGISKEDIENLHQDKLNNNNNMDNKTNLNIINIDDIEKESIKDDEEDEYKDFDLTSLDKYNYQSKYLSSCSGKVNVLMYSNLNKLVFKCLYKSINFKPHKNNDKSDMCKKISHLGQCLVNDIYKLFNERIKVNHTKILHVIDLIDHDSANDVGVETCVEGNNSNSKIRFRKRRATDKPLDLQSDTSKQAKINKDTSELQHTLQVTPQTLPEQIVPIQIKQDTPQRAAMIVPIQTRQDTPHRSGVIENQQPIQSPYQLLRTAPVQPRISNQNQSEHREIPHLYQAPRTQSMPNINPGSMPYNFYRNEPRLSYCYNPTQPYQNPPKNLYTTSQANAYIKNQRALDIGKQLPTTFQNSRELQKRLDYLNAYNYLNTAQNPANNTTQFPQNICDMRSNNLTIQTLIQKERLQQTTVNQ